MKHGSNTQRVILEADKRLSRSLLWQIQRTYFLQNGMKAWQDDVVPHDISCSPAMARTYSQIVFGYLRDCVAAAQAGGFAFDRTQPLYFIELGAGSGRLMHHFLHQFYPQFLASPYADIPLKFVLTDFVPEIISFWQNQPKLQEWVELGVLDFGLFDVMDLRPFTLINAQIELTPEQVQNPVVLFANYFFDSIPQDSFVIEDGLLCDNLLTISSSQPEPDLADPTIWERMRFTYEAIPLQEPYGDPRYNAILAEYEATFPDTQLSFPHIGLNCIQFWQKFGNGRLLLLTSDRGNSQPTDLINDQDPIPNLHGSFSLMVNFHAISQYVYLENGLALNPNHYQNNIQIAAYLLGDLPQNGGETTHAFTNAITNHSPDDLFGLKQGLGDAIGQFDLPQLLSLLRLFAWDADIFYLCFPKLLAETQACEPIWYEDIEDAVTAVWEQYLPLNEQDPLSGMIEQLLQAMTS